MSQRAKWLLLLLGTVGCGDPMLSSVTSGGVLTPPNRAPGPWREPDEVLVAIDLTALTTPDRLFAAKAGTWCVNLRSSLGAASRCVSVAETLRSAKAEKGATALDTLYLPARRGDELLAEVVGTIGRSGSTDELAKVSEMMAKVTSFSVNAATSIDLSKLEGVMTEAVRLAGGEAEKSIGQALRFRLGEPCRDSACTASVADGSQLVLTFGLAAHQRAQSRMVEGRLVSRDGAPLAVPAVVLAVRVTQWDDRVLSLDCRRDMVSAAPRDGKGDPSRCAGSNGLERQAQALRELGRLVEAMRAKSASDEELAAAHGSLLEWARATCGPLMPEASAPCHLARQLDGGLLRILPDAEALSEALRRGKSLDQELAATPLKRDACAALDQLTPSFQTFQGTIGRLPTCGPEGCNGYGGLNTLIRSSRAQYDDAVLACFAQRVIAWSEASASPGAKAMLANFSLAAVRQGVTQLRIDPKAPPTAEVVSEVALELVQAQAGLPSVPLLKAYNQNLTEEMGRVAVNYQVLKGMVSALKAFASNSLELAMAPLASSTDPYVQARVTRASALLDEIRAELLFTSAKVGAPLLTPHAQDLLEQAVELEREFQHLSAPAARPVVAGGGAAGPVAMP